MTRSYSGTIWATADSDVPSSTTAEITCVNAALKARNVPAVEVRPLTASGKITSSAHERQRGVHHVDLDGRQIGAARQMLPGDEPGPDRERPRLGPGDAQLGDAVEHLEHEADLVPDGPRWPRRRSRTWTTSVAEPMPQRAPAAARVATSARPTS